MKAQNIFYAISIFFFIILIGYFVGTYLEDVPSQIKAILSFLLAGIFFISAEILRRKNI